MKRPTVSSSRDTRIPHYDVESVSCTEPFRFSVVVQSMHYSSMEEAATSTTRCPIPLSATGIMTSVLNSPITWQMTSAARIRSPSDSAASCTASTTYAQLFGRVRVMMLGWNMNDKEHASPPRAQSLREVRPPALLPRKPLTPSYPH